MAQRDDRSEFLDHARKQAVALGRDDQVFRQGLDLLLNADRYDFTYLWTWLGVPIIQLPTDIVATQEIIWRTKPDVVIETGVARGGSVIFLASMLTLIGKGSVIGVDIDIRRHNRQAIEEHPMASRIALVEGSSIAPETLQAVKALIPPGASVMVVLDSDHSRDHVLAELQAYGPLVTRGCYLVVADTVLGFLEPHETPTKRSNVWIRGNEPLAALQAYLSQTDRFESDPVTNGKVLPSSSPGGYLLCTKD